MYKLKLLSFVVAMMLSFGHGYAQVAGERSFDFVNIPHTARLTAMGGVNVSQPSVDVNLVKNNPALMDSSMSGMLSANYVNYFASTSLSSFAYARTFDRWGTFALSAERFSIGESQGYDASGNATDSFNSGSTAITLSHARKVNHFTFGASVEFLASNVADYRASALVFDLGGVFQHPTKELSVGLTLQNMGFVMSEFSDGSSTTLPFDVQLGATFKPTHMPFRFTFTVMNLADADNSYSNTNDGIQVDEPGGLDKVFMHMTLGAELLLSDNVNLRFGYNHKVRKELKLEEAGGGAGFSYGFMIRIKAFELAYGHGGYHAGGGTNNFTLATNFNQLITKKETKTIN